MYLSRREKPWPNLDRGLFMTSDHLKIASIQDPIPRGTCMGKQVSGLQLSEARSAVVRVIGCGLRNIKSRCPIRRRSGPIARTSGRANTSRPACRGSKEEVGLICHTDKGGLAGLDRSLLSGPGA
jgi:hypothetical protein